MALSSLIFAGPAAAQGTAAGFPSKPIRIIVPFSPGGPGDMTARPIAQGLTESLGQQVIVDHRAGAGGSIGAETLAKSAPDGYTLMVTTPGVIAVNPRLHSKIGFDTLRDFAGVTKAVTSPNIMVVHPSLPVSSAADLIRFARARPGQMTYASAGNGSASHLGTEMFKGLAKVNIVHVPYKGAAPGVADLIGGHVQLMIIGLPIALPHARSGKLKALGVTSLTRSALLPDVPAIAEVLPGFEFDVWYGIFGPANLPRDLVRTVNATVNDVLRQPAVRERVAAIGAVPGEGSEEDFRRFFQGEMKKWREVIERAGIKAD
jgi:tripartite-type tricarboxylate transporter receptor subunit TctC